jgi:hypothetical protein
VIVATIADLPARLAAKAPSGLVIVMIGRAFAECVEAVGGKQLAASGSTSHHARRR